jgi:hypothetical protein
MTRMRFCARSNRSSPHRPNRSSPTAFPHLLVSADGWRVGRPSAHNRAGQASTASLPLGGYGRTRNNAPAAFLTACRRAQPAPPGSRAGALALLAKRESPRPPFASPLVARFRAVGRLCSPTSPWEGRRRVFRGWPCPKYPLPGLLSAPSRRSQARSCDGADRRAGSVALGAAAPPRGLCRHRQAQDAHRRRRRRPVEVDILPRRPQCGCEIAQILLLEPAFCSLEESDRLGSNTLPRIRFSAQIRTAEIGSGSGCSRSPERWSGHGLSAEPPGVQSRGRVAALRPLVGDGAPGVQTRGLSLLPVLYSLTRAEAAISR